MECDNKHKQFFRLRAPIYLEGYGAQKNIFWLFKSIELIDFNTDILLDEYIAINLIVPGLFTLEEIKKLNFYEYEKLIKKVSKIGEKKRNAR